MKRLYPWHRYLGLTVAGLALLLSVTGILLNHSTDLQLDKQYVRWHWLLDWYQLPATEIRRSYSLNNDNWVNQIEDKIYLNQHFLFNAENNLLGAINYNDLLLIIFAQHLYLLTTEGELIEKLNQGLPADIEAIGLRDSQHIIIKNKTGLYQSDSQLLQWTATETNSHIYWAKIQTSPITLQKHLIEQHRYHLLHWERVFLELHNGRIFGKIGVYIMDIAALLIIGLAITGLMMWSRRQRLQKKRKQTGFTLLEVLIALVIVALTLTSLMKVSAGSKRLASRSLQHIQTNAYLRAAIGAALSEYQPDMPEYPKIVRDEQQIKLENIRLLEKVSRQTQPMRISLESYQLKNKQGVVIINGVRWVKLDKAQ